MAWIKNTTQDCNRFMINCKIPKKMNLFLEEIVLLKINIMFKVEHRGLLVNN